MGERSHEKPDDKDLDASDLRVAVVVSRYNLDISKRLLRGALEVLEQRGAVDPQVVWVPGALELPLAALTLAESGNVDAIVTLGCVINGETAHFQFVASGCTEGIVHVCLDTGVPCSFGVLTTYDRDQALARSGPRNNKGAEATETAIEMANLVRKLQDPGDSA